MREARRDEPTEQFGPYVLYECLGRGGMATVHRAKRQSIEGLETPVALKRMLPWLSADGDFVKSFVREARLAAQLRHTNIAQVYDLGKVDGAYYIAMELVPGRDLREILRHAHDMSGPPPAAVVINVLFQVCDALDYAHTFKDDQGRPLGLVHRDISPANIIIGDDGTAKIVDFGVAKGTTNTLATQSGMLKGKFSYMAPEMLEGQVDARSDLFAVGIVAWEMLTAKPLFSGGDDMEVLQRIASWNPPPASSVNNAVPRDMDAWLAMALAKDPRKRFQSAAQMRAALELVARTPQMRASAPDVAGWVSWAMALKVPVSKLQPAVIVPDVVGDVPRAGTLAVDDAAIVAEIPRHVTAVGAAPAPRGGIGSSPPASTAVPLPIGPAQSSAIPSPIVMPPSGAVVAPMGIAGSSSVPAAAAYAARTVLHDHGTGPSVAITQMMDPPMAQPQLPMTQAMRLPMMPPGADAGVMPLAAIAPTISPDAGVVAPLPPTQAWQLAPHAPQQVAIQGQDFRNRPEYIAATAAYQAAAVETILPGPPPPARGTPRQRSAQMPAPATRGSPVATILIVLLCAAAAVGGFFLVQQLM